MSSSKGLLALSPLLAFIALYLVTSIVVHDFYKVPIATAFLVSCVYAIGKRRKESLGSRIDVFTEGASDKGIMQMLWIFILAGAFANVAKDIGSIDATVNLILSILPQSLVLPGLFFATCFVSLSIGTSVGTIVALVPIAAGLATSMGASVPLVTAVVVGGAFFGDNLSFISDTTIAATNSQKCNMSDKFKVNIFIALPAALIVLAIYCFIGFNLQSPAVAGRVEIIKVLPYLAVLITAMAGVNVYTVLVVGVALAFCIGLFDGSHDVFALLHSMGDGVLSMSELIIITILAGGLFGLVKHDGGIDYIIAKITRLVKGKRGAELVICALVAAVDVCTANNTVAIITVGGIAQRISKVFHVDNRRVASLLDTSSCSMQGIIPYGAQMLMASSLTHLNPLSIMPYLYYPFVLSVFVLGSIVFRFPKRYS